MDVFIFLLDSIVDSWISMPYIQSIQVYGVWAITETAEWIRIELIKHFHEKKKWKKLANGYLSLLLLLLSLEY